MKKVIVLVVVIAITAMILSACNSAYVLAWEDQISESLCRPETERQNAFSLEEWCVKKAAPNGEICTVEPFYGGSNASDVFGYIVKVYRQNEIRTYCCYVEVETVRSDGKYIEDEIEVDCDLVRTEVFF